MKISIKICLLVLVISVVGVINTGCGKTIGPDSIALPGGDGEDNSSETTSETTAIPDPTEDPKPTDVEQTKIELENSDLVSEVSKQDLIIKIYGTEVSFDDTKIEYSYDKLKSVVDKVLATGGKVYMDYSYGDSEVSASIEKDLKKLDINFTVINN